jgi:hypothetical protein
MVEADGEGVMGADGEMVHSPVPGAVGAVPVTEVDMGVPVKHKY